MVGMEWAAGSCSKPSPGFAHGARRENHLDPTVRPWLGGDI